MSLRIEVEQSFRAFIALDLPLKIKTTIANLIQPLIIQQNGEVKLTAEKKLHLTICFLGNIDYQQYQTLDEKLKKISQNCSEFLLTLTDLQLFPSLDPFTIVLVPKELKAVSNLANMVKNVVAACGIKVEKRQFQPHVTLGRFDVWQKNISKMIKNVHFSPISFRVNELKLFKSTAGANGSEYTIIGSYHLATTTLTGLYQRAH